MIDASNTIIYLILLTYSLNGKFSLIFNYYSGFIIIAIIIINVLSFMIIDLINNTWIRSKLKI